MTTTNMPKGESAIKIDSWREDLLNPDGVLIQENVLYVRASIHVAWHCPVFADALKKDAEQIMTRRVIMTLNEVLDDYHNRHQA